LTATWQWRIFLAGGTPMKAKPEVVKTTIRVPKQIWQRVQHLAIDNEVSAERVVVEALNAYLRAKGGD
jgi:hypothetical protein